MKKLHTPMTPEEMDEAIMNDNQNIAKILERLDAAERALATLSNTLHVIDATALLSLYSLIETKNLRQPKFTCNKDIVDSGCSKEISEMLETVTLVNKNEVQNAKDKTEGR